MSEDPRDHLARDLLALPYSDLNPIQRSVIDLIATAAPTGLHPELLQDDRTTGQRLADKVAAVGGSWVHAEAVRRFAAYEIAAAEKTTP